MQKKTSSQQPNEPDVDSENEMSGKLLDTSTAGEMLGDEDISSVDEKQERQQDKKRRSA